MSIEEQRLKSSLVQARKMIVKKFHALHNERVKREKKLEERYSPITNSINQLIDSNKNMFSHEKTKNGYEEINENDRIEPEEFEFFEKKKNGEQDNHHLEYPEFEDVPLPEDDAFDWKNNFENIGDSATAPPHEDAPEKIIERTEGETSSLTPRKPKIKGKRTLEEARDNSKPYVPLSKQSKEKIRKHQKSDMLQSNEIKLEEDNYILSGNDSESIHMDSQPQLEKQNEVKRKIEAKRVKRTNIRQRKNNVKDSIISLEDYDKNGSYQGLAPKRRKILVPNNYQFKKKTENRLKREKIIFSPEDYDEIGNISALPPKRRKVSVTPSYFENRERILSMGKRRWNQKMRKKHGRSLETEFIPYNDNIVYEYYDNPNELCERLQLLIASKQAGNTNHDQEINSIVEELRENNIIE